MDNHQYFHKLTILGKLSSLNEYISACRRHPKRGAELKREDQQTVEWLIRSQLRGIRITNPVYMRYAWYEPNQKRDLDNISSYGRKVIQDALVSCGVLKDDGWNYIRGFSDSFFVDKKKPRIEILITEVEHAALQSGNHRRGNAHQKSEQSSGRGRKEHYGS